MNPIKISITGSFGFIGSNLLEALNKKEFSVKVLANKNFFSTNNIKVLSIGAGLNKKKISGEASSKWGGVGWLRNDIMGMMLDSEIHNDIAKDIFDNNYLRINSPIGKINKMLDDDSEENIEKIHLMGLDWWSEFGESALNFIED